MKKFWFWKREDEVPPPGGPDGPGGEPDESSLWTGDADEDARSLEILLDTIASVTANIDLDGVLRDIVDRSLQVTQAVLLPIPRRTTLQNLFLLIVLDFWTLWDRFGE